MKKVYTIGRDPQNDIVINDRTNVVSRSHATIKIDGSKISIIDQSQNGTYVNGMRMASNQEFPVTRKDSISFANVAELDWSLIPDPRKAYVKVFSTVVLAGIISAVVYYAKNNITDNEGKDKGTIVKCDSIDLKNTQKPDETKNISEEKAQEEKTQEEKAQEEKTQEEKTQGDDSTKKDSTSVDKDKAKPKVSEKKKPGNSAKSDSTKVEKKDKSETDIPLY